MFATRDINRQALLNCDDDDDNGNGAIREFYMRNLHDLKLHPMSSVPSSILSTISVLLHHTLLNHHEWQEYANLLGITDSLYLAKIQARARASESQELYIAFKCALPHKSFAQVIILLLNLGRYEILKRIQSDVEQFLARNATTETKEIASVNYQFSELKPRNQTNTASAIKESNRETISSVKNLSDKFDILVSSYSLLDKHEKQEIIPLQQSPMNEDCTAAIQNNISITIEAPLEKNLARKIDLFTSTSDKEALTVFIPHSEVDSCMARDLSTMLKDERIIVTTLSDMSNLIAMDNARKALTTMFRQVDFIVPIVSETFLQQINANVYDDYLDCKDAMDNKWIYQLISNEYANNRFVNFRVRPVILPNMSRRMLIHDPILSYSFRLWGEVPKLIRILKETKLLIPEYSQVNSMRNT